MRQTLTARDKTALEVAVVSWIVCGALAWIFRLPVLLMIALGVSWVCGQAVIRVTPVEKESPLGKDESPNR